MKFKKITALIITLTMIAGLIAIPHTAWAKDTGNPNTVSENRANVSFIYLGTSATTAKGQYPGDTAKTPSEIEANKYIWIGVQYSNLSKIRDLMKSDKRGTAEGGVNVMVNGMTYDATYLEPVTNAGAIFNNAVRKNYEYSETYEGYLYSATVDADLEVSDATKGAEPILLTGENLKDIQVTISVADGSDWYSSEGAAAARLFHDPDGGTLGDDPVVLAAFAFKVLSVPTPGTKVLQANLSGERFTFSINDPNAEQVGTMWMSDQATDADINLKNYFNLTNADGSERSNGLIDLFPASASDVLSGLTKKTDATKALTGYIEGQKFDPTGLVLTPVKSESGNQADISGFTATDYKGVKFYVDDADKTAATLAKTRELTTSTALATTDSTKHVYALYELDGKTAIADLGAITVAADSVSSISYDSSSPFKSGTYYAGTTIASALEDAGAIKFTYKKASDTSKTINVESGAWSGTKLPLNIKDGTNTTPTSEFGFYVKKGTAANEPLTEVTDTTEFAENDTFYIALADKGGKTLAQIGTENVDYTQVTVTNGVTKNSIVLNPTQTVSATPADLHYAEADDAETQEKAENKMDFSNVELSYKRQADTSYDSKPVRTIGAANLIFYTGNTENPAENQFVSGTTSIQGTNYNEALKGKYVYVVPADAAAGTTPVLVGQLGTRVVDGSNTAIAKNGTTNIKTNPTYGDKVVSLFDGTNKATVTLNFDNGNAPKYTYDSTAKTFKNGNETLSNIGVSVRISNGTTPTAVTDPTTVTLTPDITTVEFVYDNGTPADTSDDKVVASISNVQVGKKAVTYSITTNSTISKTYDGTTAIDADTKTAVKAQIPNTQLIDADKAAADPMASIQPTGQAVTGLDYAYANKNKGTDKTINVSGTPEVLGIQNFADKYTLTADTASVANGALRAIKGTINAKELTISEIAKANVPTIEVGATTLTGTIPTDKAIPASTANSNVVKVGENTDDVKFIFTYTYPNATEAGEKDVTISGIAIVSGADKDNYELATTGNATSAKGEVINKTLESISVKVAPTHAKDKRYPDVNFDPAGLVMSVKYQGAEAIDKSLADFLADGGTITLVDRAGTTKTINKDTDLTANPVALKTGETTVTISFGDAPNTKTTTQTITIGKKQIKLSDLTFKPKKKYDGLDENEVQDTADFKAGDIENGDTVKVNAKYKYGTSNAGTTDVTVSDITLVGDDAGDYEIVDGEAGFETPINAATTKVLTNQEDVIEPADNDVAPTAPTVNVDSKTNNIVVTEPVGDTYEYSKDGGVTWQSEPTFTDLAQGTRYPITVRTKATANVSASTPSEATTVKTLDKLVMVYKKGADLTKDQPLYQGYTDKTQFTSLSADTKEVLGKSYGTLYTDNEAKTKLVASEASPYVLQAENIFYYKSTGGGGGGGGGATVTITFPNAIEKAAVGETIKLEPTITGSTATPKWTSGDEKIATVDENGNVTIVGEGTTNIKVNVAGTTKAVTVTGTPAAATPVPTVVPVPTDKPVIDTTYTKPYASGYEDSTFRPQNNITRAELAAMIARMSNGDDIADGAYRASFPDVEADAWYSKYIGYLEGLNVLSGYEDGTFRPNNTVTRGEICSVIARAQRYDLIPYSGEFTDVTDSDWARDYIETLAKKNVVSGYEDSTFGPYSPLTRAEAVAMINRVLEPSTPVITFRPNDVSGHWAENDVLMAVNERELANAKPTEEPQATEAPAEATEEPVATEAPAEATEEPEATEAPAEATAEPEATEAPAAE